MVNVRHQRRFTLIELLAVTVVVVIVIAIAIPAFSKITTGSGVDAAARTAVGQLRLGRQQAVTQRVKIAVIMPRAEGTVLPQYQYSCVRMAVVTGSSSPYTFSKWVDNSEWNFLPPGASIMEADADEGIANGTGVFCRDPVENANRTVDGVDLTKVSSGGGTTNGVRAAIFLANGRMSAEAGGLHVTVGEAVRQGGTWVIKDVDADAGTKNQSCRNQMCIDLDYYTGRCVMKTPDKY